MFILVELGFELMAHTYKAGARKAGTLCLEPHLQSRMFSLRG
jgi:hypothetical protein